MPSRRVWVVGGVLALALAAGGTGIAIAAGGDDEQAITGPALEKASAAALAHTGGGRVTGTEVGDEESYYEVEVTLADGREVDVQLDRDFRVVGAGDDADDAEDENEPADEDD